MTRVVLVEGESDRNAVLTLAACRGHDLGGERVEVVAMGGATNIRRALREYGPHGQDAELHGLFDEAEERFFRHALAHEGIGTDWTRESLAAFGFHCCVADLEDELIRAVGVTRVEAVIEAEDERRSWDRFRQMPYHRTSAPRDQLHRFLGTRSGRKIRYGGLLAAALAPGELPPPLAALLADLER